MQRTDQDLDGISIRAASLQLNGAAIRSLAGVAANIDLGSHAIANAPNHRLIGSNLATPTAASVSISSSPASGDTYGAGEAVRVRVGFTVPVVVTGGPKLVLTLGSRLAEADFHDGDTTKTLTFRYVVGASDRDSDGLSVGALALNGGTIRSTLAVAATLALGARAPANDASHKVGGRNATAPSVSAVTISSTPASGATYGAGEAISVRVQFTTPVNVTGAPQLALTVGSRIRQAAYAEGDGTDTLAFRYVAQATDVDDGLGIGPRQRWGQPLRRCRRPDSIGARCGTSRRRRRACPSGLERRPLGQVGRVTAFHPEMAVHGKYRQPCPICAAPVQRIVRPENETNYCATCQTGGRLLADRSLSRLLKDTYPKRIEDLE